MDNKYIDKVIGEMSPFFEENGFSLCECGAYKNDKKAVKIEYSDERQMYLLNVAEIGEDGNIGEFVELNAWLFDDSQNAKDAESVGIDFTETLRKNMGIVVKPRANSAVELPTANSDKYTVSAFAKKVLDTYPQLKDDYKEYVAKYGNFLYINFFGEHLVPLLKATINENTKRSGKKVVDLIETAFVKGDNETTNIAVACLSAACFGDEKTTAIVSDLLAENQNLKSAVVAFTQALKGKKALRNALVK